MDAQKAARVMDELAKLYPEARPELHFSNPFETLIATILSAQCTDRRVNQVTAKLFAQYPDAFAMAKLSPEELEPLIRECGLYHNKAKNIAAVCRALAEHYGGEVPNTREELMQLPGVGQKTAGVVLMAAFGDPQIPVDTHVFRVSRRIGPRPTRARRRRWSFSCARCCRRRSGPSGIICSSGTAAAAARREIRPASAAR